MSFEDKPLTFLVGPRACGKSTLARILRLLTDQDDSVLVHIETSNLIGVHMNKRTPLGILLLKHHESMRNGHVMQAHDVIVQMIMESATTIWSQLGTKQIVVTGTPRHPEQSKNVLGALGKGRVRVVHIRQDKDQTTRGVLNRQKESGKVRTDETDKAIETAWQEYNSMILPAVGVFNGEALHINRSDPVNHRIVQVIHHMKMPDHFRAKILNRLNTRTHPASVEIARLDSMLVQK